MATGVRPFWGDSPASHHFFNFEGLSGCPHWINPALPPDLDRIIRRCLAKDPVRRYQNLVDLRNDLEELQELVKARDGSIVARTSGVRRCRWQLVWPQWVR